ncbi:hypothetical protein EDD86DRAFT_198874 [Gorgonomyces haynaldii]|nr:hypothetical protein EDD86DRAFT_198874 [Gorgonomyces haynaldii]
MLWPTVQAASLGCGKLTGTTTCPSFAQFEFYRGDTTRGLVLNTVQDFDNYVNSRLPTTAAGVNVFKTTSQCPNFATQEVPFFQTSLCGIMVEIGRTQGCNAGQTIRQVCKSSVQTTVNALNSIFSNASLCTQNVNRQGTPNNDFSVFLAGTAPGADGNCVVNQENDSNCGFSSVALATTFCQSNSQNTCCATIAAKQTSSVAPAATAPVTSSSATTAPTAASAAATSTQDAINPLIIGGAVGGAALLAIVGVTIYYAFGKKKKSSTSPTGKTYSQSEPAQMAETMMVIYDYQANLFDELTLNEGDNIIVKVKFDDGWAWGFNMNTKQEGSFPLACVAPLDYDANSSAPRDSWAPSKRISSMIAPSSNRYSTLTR